MRIKKALNAILPFFILDFREQIVKVENFTSIQHFFEIWKISIIFFWESLEHRTIWSENCRLHCSFTPESYFLTSVAGGEYGCLDIECLVDGIDVVLFLDTSDVLCSFLYGIGGVILLV